MRNIKFYRAIPSMLLVSTLTGCATFDSISEKYFKDEEARKQVEMMEIARLQARWEPSAAPISADYFAGSVVYMDGEAFAKNRNGEIVIAPERLKKLTDTETYSPAPVAGLELSSREVGALMADKDAFFVFMENPDLSKSGDVAFPVLKGSLRENLERFAKQAELESVVYEVDFDYFVSQDQNVIAPDKNQLLYVLLNGYPIEATIEKGPFGEVLRVFAQDGYENKISFVVNEGSLKENAIRLAHEAEWDYEWAFDYDFAVPKSMILRGSSYEDLMSKLLTIQQYPINMSHE